MPILQEVCLFAPSFVVFFIIDDGKRSVELFQEQEATHFMGEGEPGEGKRLMSLFPSPDSP